jgi:cell wall-associated NlpC family hydrolase
MIPMIGKTIGKTTVSVLLCGVAWCAAWGQLADDVSDPAQAKQGSTRSSRQALSNDDRLSVIAAALDSRTPHGSERDCSHLVHAIYERAGFSYDYADSEDLYAGVEGFQRVKRPQTGDLIVWHGHAGIVIQPSRHIFFSFLHAGPGIDNYEAPYWKGRGHARFYRYIKHNPCPQCALVHDKSVQWK